MTKVAILPVPADHNPTGEATFHAVAGDKHSRGRTAGQALDALTAQLSGAESGDTLVIVQSQRSDSFFDADQQQRLAAGMARWRAARDRGESLPPDEARELEMLVEAELRASGLRSFPALHSSPLRKKTSLR